MSTSVTQIKVKKMDLGIKYQLPLLIYLLNNTASYTLKLRHIYLLTFNNNYLMSLQNIENGEAYYNFYKGIKMQCIQHLSYFKIAP